MKNRQFGVIVLCFLGLFSLLFVTNQNTFGKESTCKNFDLVYGDYLKGQYFYNGVDGHREATDIGVFYSKNMDTCIVRYQIHFENDTRDETSYVLDDIFKNSLIFMCSNTTETDCPKKRVNKVHELE